MLRAASGPTATVTQTTQTPHITAKAVVNATRGAQIDACHELVLIPHGSGVPHPQHLQMDAIGKLTMHMKIHFIVVNTEVMFVKLLQSVLDPSDPPTVTEALIRTPSGAEKVWCREERGRRNFREVNTSREANFFIMIMNSLFYFYI